MGRALMDSCLHPNEIDLISCHATATQVGNISELSAIKTLFGSTNLIDKGLENFFSEFYEKDFNNFSLEYDKLSKQEHNINGKNRLKSLNIMATKTQIGHLLGAAGSVELLFALKCLEENIIIDNYNTKDPYDNSLTYMYNTKGSYSRKSLKNLIKNSFAFGGVNSSLVISKLN